MNTDNGFFAATRNHRDLHPALGNKEDMVGAVSLRKDDIVALIFANAMAMTGFGEKRIGIESYGRVERQVNLPVFVFPHIRAKPRYASSARNSVAGANACAPRGARVNRPAAKSSSELCAVGAG